MLQSLSIKNFALVEDLKLDWTPGLNVLTGETGAGKSIIIDAISILLGTKAGPTIIRHNADKAQIEGIFHLSPQVTNWLKQQELLEPDAGELTVSREVNKSGSRFRVNGTLVNQALVQELKQFLVSVHAQHEAATLLSSSAQLALLDALGDKKHEGLLEEVRGTYLSKKDLDEQLKSLEISEEERMKRLDFARFQLSELNEAKLAKDDEDIELAQQAQILANVVSLASCAMNAQQALTGSSDSSSDSPSHSGYDALSIALGEIENGAKLDPNLEAPAALLKASLANVEEAASELRKYHDNLDTDPETLQLIESRIAQLATIKRKYGPSLVEAIERQQTLTTEVSHLENAQVHLDELNSRRKTVISQLEELAKQLSKRRKALADTLSKRIEEGLVQLGMERCHFEIVISPQAEASTTGSDKIEFMIAPNPGQPLMPLSKIASGGELSRIMLVIKSIFAEADKVATVIFDEIDTGLSGLVLKAMKDKLAHLAKSHQILCITHQPLIAASANNHLQIEKEHTAKTTTVSVKALVDDDRLKALAQMASGHRDEEVALSFARSLLNKGMAGG